MVCVIFLDINNYIRKMTSYSDIILYKYIPSDKKKAILSLYSRAAIGKNFIRLLDYVLSLKLITEVGDRVMTLTPCLRLC